MAPGQRRLLEKKHCTQLFQRALTSTIHPVGTMSVCTTSEPDGGAKVKVIMVMGTMKVCTKFHGNTYLLSCFRLDQSNGGPSLLIHAATNKNVLRQEEEGWLHEIICTLTVSGNNVQKYVIFKFVPDRGYVT